MKHFEDEWLQVYEGDCSKVMAALPEESVHTIITSPPYYGLRDYGTDGQLGQEETPEEYVSALVETFRVAHRVLRGDGLLWLNLGDSFAGGNGRSAKGVRRGKDTERPAAAKPKDLLGIPWKVAFALRDDGWFLRRDIVWNKPNPMPESVDDRPTSSHEYIFMLAKSKDYFYDAHAVKEPISEAMAAAIARGPRPDRQYQHDEHNRNGKRSGNRAFADSDSLARIALGRNRRSVWTIPTVAYPGAHYATFPPKLVEPMIQAATSEYGVCRLCGAPWERKIEVTRIDHHTTTQDGKTADGPYAAQAAIRNGAYVDTNTVGWSAPRCDHQAERVPAVVLDPFAGSGTVGVVANRLSRRAILIDINAEYLKLQMERNAEIPLGL